MGWLAGQRRCAATGRGLFCIAARVPPVQEQCFSTHQLSMHATCMEASVKGSFDQAGMARTRRCHQSSNFISKCSSHILLCGQQSGPFPEKSVQSSICISTGMGRGCNFIVCHKSQAFAVQRGYKLRGIVNLLCFMALDLSDVQPFVILNNEKANTAVLLEDTTLNAGLHHYSMCNTDRQPRQAPNNALETPPIALRLENGAQAFLTRTHFVDCKVKRTEGAKAYLVHRNSSFVPEIRSSSASKRLAWSLTSV